MSGISGLAHFLPDGNFERVAHELEGVQLRPHEHIRAVRSRHGEATFVSTLKNGIYNLTRPLAGKDESSLLAIQGEVFLPNGKAVDETNWQETLLRPLLEDPTGTCSSLDGAFVLALYDTQTNRLILASDRFGNFALHYRQFPWGVAFATRFSMLAHIEPFVGLDSVGLHQHLGLGHTLGGRTLLTGISRLQAASYLIADRSLVTETRYYRPHYVARSFASAREVTEIADRFAVALQKSVAQRAEQSGAAAQLVAVALTGGLDTRLTWSALYSIGKAQSFKAFTLGLPESTDMRLSRQIAARLNATYLPIPFDTDFLLKNIEYWVETVERTEGGLGIASSTTVQAWHEQEHDYHMLLDSHGGALYRRQFMRTKKERIAGRNGIAEEMFAEIEMPLMKSRLLRPEIRRDSELHSTAALEGFFGEFSDVGDLGDVMDHYYATQLSVNRYGLSGNAQLSFLGLHQPLLNVPMYELVQSLPETLRLTNWVHRKIIRKLAPLLEHFPLDDQGFSVPYRGFTFWRYFFHGREKFSKVGSGIWGDKLSRNLAGRRPLTDASMLFLLHSAFAEEALRDRMNAVEGITDREAVESAFISLRKGDIRDNPALIQLLDLAILLPYLARP